MSLVVKNTAGEGKHEGEVLALLLHEGKLYSGSEDGKIMQWDEDLNKLLESDAHSTGVFSLAAIGETLYSCSNDGIIKSWTLDLNEKDMIALEACEFWKLAAHNGILYAGDDGGLLRTFENDLQIGRYDILDAFKDLTVHNGIVYSSKDATVIMTEIGEGNKCSRRTVPGRAPFCLVANKLVATTRSGTDITIHENNKDNNYQELGQIQDAHKTKIRSMLGALKNGEAHVYTAGEDELLKEWKLTDESCDGTCQLKMGFVVLALTAGGVEGVVYAAGTDGNLVKLSTA